MSENAVQKFLSALFNQDLDQAIEAVHEDAVFSAPGPDTVPNYRTFHGKKGAREFIAILGELFDTEAFEVYEFIEKDDYVFAIGLMKHRVKKTGRLFECEWVLVCKVKDGQIISYKMFEDTAALENAYLDR
ncbi:MAG: nuclear transport factor 2 family protein [Thermodesulfobacteriota bacterium]